MRRICSSGSLLFFRTIYSPWVVTSPTRELLQKSMKKCHPRLRTLLFISGCNLSNIGLPLLINPGLPLLINPGLPLLINPGLPPLINPGLPLLIKQRYGAELRNCSLASLKPDIPQALASLRDELRNTGGIRAMRIGGRFGYNCKSVSSNRRQAFSHKSCVLSKTAGPMSNSHNLIAATCLIVTRKPWAGQDS